MKLTDKNKQKGAALLLFVLISTVIASSLLLKSLNLNKSGVHITRNTQALLQAKQALIGYAISYGDRNANNLPGYLPCPDFDGDGISDSPCGISGQSSLGRLPWQTLGLQTLRDNAGECLWYAVSGAYKENPVGAIKPGAPGQFLLFDSDFNSLNGTNNSEAGIAVIFSTGKNLGTQNRSLSSANATECASTRTNDRVRVSTEYLETHSGINNARGSSSARTLLGETISAIPTDNHSAFINAGQLAFDVPTSINDQIIKISPSDFTQVYQYMQQVIAERVRRCLNNYATANTGKLSWPAILNPPGNPGYTDNATQLRFGRIADNLINSQADGLSSLWPMDPVQPTSRCFNWNWWPTIKESVFIAIDESISATAVSATPSLTVDGTVTSAAIIVAGRENISQSRTTGTEKNTISNYLESSNVIDSGTGAIPPGDENFITNDSATPTFNDYVCTLSSCP